jgi:hypothetical protein
MLITSMPHSTIYEGQSGIDPLYTCLLDKGCDFMWRFRLLLQVASGHQLGCAVVPTYFCCKPRETAESGLARTS